MPKSSTASRRPRDLSGVKAGQGEVEVLDEGALGDLEDERLGREVRVAKRTADVVDEVGILELKGREVDAHVEVVADQAALSPLLGLAGGVSEDLSSERDDQPGGLGDRDELKWRQQPSLGWFQRTSASTPTSRPVWVTTIGW